MDDKLWKDFYSGLIILVVFLVIVYFMGLEMVDWVK